MTNVTNRNDLGLFVAPRRWSKAAKMCYERGCVCGGCELNLSYLSRKCQMKASVLESVRVLGKPFERVKVVMGE